MKNELIHEDISSIFKNIHSIDSILKKFLRMQAEAADWIKLTRSIENCIILHKIVN